MISAFAPWAVIPLLMLGGAYLCFEGFEKIAHKYLPHDDEHADEGSAGGQCRRGRLEKQKIGGAIRTDFILSAEIIAITLVPSPSPASPPRYWCWSASPW